MTTDLMNDEREGLPEGWVGTNLGEVVDVLDSRRVPVNNDERNQRIAGKPDEELFPYYGATGQVGQIDDFIFDEPLILLGEDGVQFFDRQKEKAYQIVGKTWVNNHAHVLRASDGITANSYVTHYLNVFEYLISGFRRSRPWTGALLLSCGAWLGR